MKRIIISLIISFSAFTTGCGTKAGAYGVFSDDIQRLIGTSFDKAHIAYIGYLAEEAPLEEKTLSNGNTILKYTMSGVRSDGPACTVFVELNTKKDLIIEASYIGKGCWRPY